MPPSLRLECRRLSPPENAYHFREGSFPIPLTRRWTQIPIFAHMDWIQPVENQEILLPDYISRRD